MENRHSSVARESRLVLLRCGGCPQLGTLLCRTNGDSNSWHQRESKFSVSSAAGLTNGSRAPPGFAGGALNLVLDLWNGKQGGNHRELGSSLEHEKRHLQGSERIQQKLIQSA